MIWTFLKEKIERETGYKVSHISGINDNELILVISTVEKTDRKNVYCVKGELSIKEGQECWSMLLDLLDLELTGTDAQANLVKLDDKFLVMSVGFSILVEKESERKFVIKEIK